VAARRASISANFDLDDVRPFLLRLGWDRRTAAITERWIRGIHLEQGKSIEVSITYDGKSSKLFIGCFMDDIDAPDLEFRGPPKLIREIRAHLHAFMKERSRA
jgi:hypothetical protein